jgi:hypothetical protein
MHLFPAANVKAAAPSVEYPSSLPKATGDPSLLTPTVAALVAVVVRVAPAVTNPI